MHYLVSILPINYICLKTYGQMISKCVKFPFFWYIFHSELKRRTNSWVFQYITNYSFILYAENIGSICQETGILLDNSNTLKAVNQLLVEMKTNPKRFKGNRILFIHTGMFFFCYFYEWDWLKIKVIKCLVLPSYAILCSLH